MEEDVCLSIPSKIVEILPDNYAVVDTMGVKERSHLILCLNPLRWEIMFLSMLDTR